MYNYDGGKILIVIANTYRQDYKVTVCTYDMQFSASWFYLYDRLIFSQILESGQ